MTGAREKLLWTRRMSKRFERRNCLAIDEVDASCMKAWKRKIWMFLENPFSSYPAMIFMVIYVMFTLANVTQSIVLSVPSMRLPSEDQRLVNYTRENITNPKIALYLTTVEPVWAIYLYMSCLGFFALEIVVRFLVYPSVGHFFKQASNVLDIVCFLCGLLVFVIGTVTIENETPETMVELAPLFLILASSPMLRLIRLMNIAYNHPLVRVLFLSLFDSWKILLLMSLVMIFGTLLFGHMIYFADFYNEKTFPDIPIACWWAIITMTTVGYGDQYPGSFAGYIVGSLCALTGLVLTALPIAVIGNNFNTLYTFVNGSKKVKTASTYDCGKFPLSIKPRKPSRCCTQVDDYVA